MQILILGGSGMLGHQLWRFLSLKYQDTYATIKRKKNDYNSRLLLNDNIIESIDARDFNDIRKILEEIRPKYILNCIGITKRKHGPEYIIDSIKINALLPHELAKWGRDNKVKIVNFSTDCVFNGKDGNYSDDSMTNAEDLYGRTKALGEISGKYALTLRSSFIGQELSDGTELLKWFLSQTSTVKGYSNAIYTGFTTFELCRIIEKLLIYYPECAGIYNISSEPISKYDLLVMIKNKLKLDIEVIPFEEFKCDRSLDSTKFRQEFNYKPPSWEKMIEELSVKI